ncbi:MAG: hypothetical protein U0Q55_09875 [Vicinamibacterales bacterium]
MHVRLPPRYRAAANELRAQVTGLDAQLLEVIFLSAALGLALPQDDILHGDLTGRIDPRPKLARGIRRIFGGPTPAPRDLARAGRRLAARLVRALRARDLTTPDAQGYFEPLRSLLSFAPSILGIDCVVPVEPVRRTAWTTIVNVFAEVHRSRVSRVDLPFLDTRRLRRLLEEARREFVPERDASGATSGLSGRRLAVDPRLAARVGRALGERLEPAFIARYVFYSRPGEYFWPHTDSPLVHVNVFVCLEHRVPPGRTSRSAFVGYHADGSAERFEMRPGQAMAAHTQGLVHAREPLQEGESVTLLAIALRPSARPRHRKPSARLRSSATIQGHQAGR